MLIRLAACKIEIFEQFKNQDDLIIGSKASLRVLEFSIFVIFMLLVFVTRKYIY